MKKRNVIKRFATLMMTTVLACLTLPAQETDILNAMKPYRKVHSLEATVTCIKHNAALVDDTRLEGKLYFKAPGLMCMTFEGGKDMLLMEGNTFTMVENGHKSIARGKTQQQFESLAEVFKRDVLGMTVDETLADYSKVETSKEGNLCTLTVLPAGNGGKASRRMLYTSFVLTIDIRTGECKSLRLNGRGQNYTQYDFSGFKKNITVNTNVFKLPSES